MINGLLKIELLAFGCLCATSLLGQTTSQVGMNSGQNMYWQADEQELNNTIPEIYYFNEPTANVWIDGEPRIIVDTVLRMYRVLNTPHLIIKNHNDNKFYLFGNQVWYVSDSATTGYKFTKTIPEVIKLMETLVKGNKSVYYNAYEVKPKVPPQVFISLKPSLVIYTDGEPEWDSLGTSGLQFIKNSPYDIIRDTLTQTLYLQLSGRWFTSPGDINGPWQFFPQNKLPAAFAAIPDNGIKAHLRYHISGTPEANAALAKTRELNTIEVNRGIDSTIKVDYNGGAIFASLPGSKLFIAQNSNLPVVSYENLYFVLYNGIWYKSKELNGPWEVSALVPADLDKIPPEYQIYNSKYVHLIDSTEEKLVFGYTGGYQHSFIQNGVVVFGTGHEYINEFKFNKFFLPPFTWLQGLRFDEIKGWNHQPLIPYFGVKPVSFKDEKTKQVQVSTTHKKK